MRQSKFIIYISILIFTIILTGCDKPPNLANEISGVWKGEGSIIEISLIQSKKFIKINEVSLPVVIKQVDTDNLILVLGVTFKGQKVTWTIRQLYDEAEKNFSIKITLHDGKEEELAFVRNLS